MGATQVTDVATDRESVGPVLPRRLQRLIEDGNWPTAWQGKMSSVHRIDIDLVRALAPGENEIYFDAPPFWTVAQEMASSDAFWKLPQAALWQIDPERTVVFGDFGLGSDAPLALDYRSSLVEPSVIRLQWADVDPKTNNRWVTVAPTFSEFCRLLRIRRPARPPMRVHRRSLSRKQQLYVEILQLILPDARNAQTGSAWRRLWHGNRYAELELVHNIAPLLAHAGMTRYDVYWLNIQARNYATTCEGSSRNGCKTILSCIRDLVDMVPPELSEDLQWRGPASSPKLAPMLSVPMPMEKPAATRQG